LKPYLEKFDDDLAINHFEKKVLTRIEKEYPKQKNGKVLLPFKRLFLIGYKSHSKANSAAAKNRAAD
jgi:trans-aconitate 2-methyltransferase